MKSIRCVSLTKFLLLAIALLAGSATFSQAQSATGKFTLPREAHWGKAVLPAGDYKFSVGDGPMAMVSVMAVGGSPRIFVLPQSVSSMKPADSEQLILTSNGEETFVSSLCLTDVGMVLHYPVPEAKEAPAVVAAASMK